MEGPRPPERLPNDSRPRPAVGWAAWSLTPAILISLALHAALLGSVAVVLRSQPSGAITELAAGDRAVLDNAHRLAEEMPFEHSSAPAAHSTQPPIASPRAPVDLDPSPAVDSAPASPDRRPIVGARPLAGGGKLAAAITDSGPATLTAPSAGRTRVTVFGVEGEGSKFVYVFDRSGSMGGAGRNALQLAKLELLRSLETLDQSHQFQVIFYNERPEMFSPAGQPGRLAFGNDASKLRAWNFVNGIVPDGGTEHENALAQALRLQPDVIFFLTDGADPELSPTQLARIRQANGGRVSINVVEFGLGASHSDNFLVRLAQENGGEYRYIDISELKAGTP